MVGDVLAQEDGAGKGAKQTPKAAGHRVKIGGRQHRRKKRELSSVTVLGKRSGRSGKEQEEARATLVAIEYRSGGCEGGGLWVMTQRSKGGSNSSDGNQNVYSCRKREKKTQGIGTTPSGKKTSMG